MMTATSGATMYHFCSQTAIVRSERLILANPMDALPSTELYMYKA
jgi:hypothetical protein